MNDGPRGGEEGEQLGLFLEAGRPAVPPPAANRTARELYSFENLWNAYRQCRRTKRGTLNALAFEVDAEAGLFSLQDELRSHRYRPGTSICFVSDGAKPREVFAADFGDRIVHHLLLGRIEPAFERRFIHDSYACRRGKGVLAASDRLTEFLRSATANRRRGAWALQLDVASFFPSIHKETLYRILCAQVADPELRWLTATILFHDPTKDFVFHKGPRFVPPPTSAAYPVEARKSLFGRSGLTGLPIGNLTSQFWANCYLNELDQFVKRGLGCRYYLRYVDDMVLLAPDPETLFRWRDAIREFASSRLYLQLRRDGDEPFPVSRGIDFAGWKTWADHRLPRRRTLASLERRVRDAARLLRRTDHRRRVEVLDLRTHTASAPGSLRRSLLLPDALWSTLTAYSGHLRWGGSWGDWHRLWQRHSWLDSVYRLDGWSVGLRWTPSAARATRLWRQYWKLAGAAADRTLVFCPVGAFVEFRGAFAVEAAEVLGLRRVALPRGVWAFGAGFPTRLLPHYAATATGRGWSVVVVRPGAWRGRRACRERRVVAVIRPVPAPGQTAPPAGSPGPLAAVAG